MKVRDPFASYPPMWDTFDDFAPIAGADRMGFPCANGDVNRFAARYRAAKTFRRAEFEDLVLATADGYSALCQLLLTYSAFEHFLRCIGVELQHSLNLYDAAERAAALAKLRTLNGQADLFKWLKPHLDNKGHKRQIDSHLAGQDCNLFYLAGGMRHAFAHGILTATPVGVPPASVATVSRYMCRGLMKVMDREFEGRMLDFLATLH